MLYTLASQIGNILLPRSSVYIAMLTLVVMVSIATHIFFPKGMRFEIALKYQHTKMLALKDE